MKRTQGIAKATLILLIGTLASKALGFVREMVVAYQFGAGAITDAFVLTNSIPTMLFTSIATAITINYIPVFSDIGEKKRQNIFTSKLINISCVIILIGCIIVQIVPKTVLWIFASGLSVETEKYAILMLRIVIFSAFPIILGHIFQAYAQVNKSFYSTALFGIIVNIFIISFTFAAKENSFYLLSIGYFVANLIGTIFLFCCIKGYGYKYEWAWKYDDDIKKIILLTLPLLVENIASEMSLLVDKNVASYLEKGTISGLGYAGTLGNIASSIIASALITATFPTFSKMIAEHKEKVFNKQFSKYGTFLSYILAPITVFMFIMSKEIVILLFERGKFDSSATRIVSESMRAYAVGILPMGVQSYIIRGFYCMKDTKWPVIIKVFSLGCNIVLNLIMVQKWQHVGIALSTSISYYIALFLLSIVIYKKHKVNASGKIILEFFFCFLLSVFCGGVTKLIIDLLSFENIIVKLLFFGGVSLGLYFLLLFATRKSIRDLCQECFLRFVKKNERD